MVRDSASAPLSLDRIDRQRTGIHVGDAFGHIY